MWLNDSDIQPAQQFVFDLEWVGDVVDNPQRCFIWEIACVHVATGTWFHQVIMPTLPGHNFSRDHDGCGTVPGVTREMLSEMDHVPLRQGMLSFVHWLFKQGRGQPVILIAHNCFRADMLVLNYQMQMCGVQPCNRIWFMDSLQFARHRLRNAQSFSLADLCTLLEYNGESGTHRAREDTEALLFVLRKCSLPAATVLISGLATEYGTISLSVVDGIGAGTAKRISKDTQIFTLWDLYSHVLATNYNLSVASCTAFFSKYVRQDALPSTCQSFVDTVRMLYL